MTVENNTDTNNEAAEAAAEAQNEQVEATEAAAEAEVEVETAGNDELAAALEEIAKLKDQMVREQAETQNIRKRVQRDVENARKFALEKFVDELLPVVDNLERAAESISAEGENMKSAHEGVELTLKNLVAVLAKFNVEQLNPVGEPFDPQVHEALTMVPNPNMEPNSVMDVMQKGYVLNGRLVRAAKVVVSKAP